MNTFDEKRELDITQISIAQINLANWLAVAKGRLERGESEKALCAITKAIAARENMFKIETGLKKTLRDIKSLI